MSKPAKSRRTNILRLSGELGIKSPQVRKRFQNRLVHNIHDALRRAEVDYELHRQWARIDVESDDERAGEILARIYGIKGVVPATRYSWETLDDILDLGEQLYAERVEGKKFAVRARRVGNRDGIDFQSGDVNRQLGARLFDASAGVDLDHPEVVVGVEIREDEVFFLDEELPGPAGLPMGTEGKALCLMSGGFDSAVAGWMMQKRGIDLDFLFFNLGGPAHERGVRDVTKRLCELWSNGYAAKLHVVDLRSLVAEMKQNVRGSYWQLLLKRLMMRAAHLLCVEQGYPAMITGESAGQVSSQTLMNLAAIQQPIPTPILRPLVGLNKNDITELARHIGTFDISASVPEFCALDGGRPVTTCTPDKLDVEEARVSQTLLETLVEKRRTHDVLEMASGDEIVDVEINRVPEGAVVLDLRTHVADNAWSYPDSVHLPFEKAIENVAYLPKEGTYLLCCEVGLKSAFLAEQMRRAGFEAYSFRGGTHALKRHQKKQQTV
ncbi:tRNA uracil 4-sulfurtransferase ThiI [Persicimonas caeni]|uniref:tRNA uracil 4-sulfurtransferase ThiI n=1 Tax=Persicimonas caeni TaxID=2292766 RepID=UPI00143D6EDD|nr:tRNA uracil 4-sulfurtransferase ThiI [Persicimonas caeni]